MNIVKLLLAFAPWIVFGLIAGPSFFNLEIAIVISLTITVVLGYKTMEKKFLLPWVTFIFFTMSLITIVLMKNVWVATHLKILSYMTLVGVTWGSLLIGKPFTMQYAKEEVDEGLWNSESFIRSNQIITAFWGAVFFINLGINYYLFLNKEFCGWAFTVIGWILIVVGLVFTVEYTKFARKRREKTQSQ